MKISTTVTKQEVANTKTMVMFDPCRHMNCGASDCRRCPLVDVAEELRQAQSNFLTKLDNIEVAAEE